MVNFAKKTIAWVQSLAHRSFRKLGLFFLLIGPGIITSNVDNDTGGITTYSLAGAEFALSQQGCRQN